MKQLFSKFLIVLCLTTIVVPITLLDNFHPEKVLASTEDIYNGLPSDSGDPTMDNGEADADARVGGIEIDGWTAPVDTPVVPPAISDINTFFDSNYTGSADSGFLWAAENITQNPKLIINPADMQDLRILSCLGNVIPDYAHHDDSLASATGKSLQDIVDLKRDHYEDWQKLITQAQETARQNIVANLKTDLPNFACIAGVDTTRATDMMQYDQDSVNAIIDYAQNKIVIDRRVLMLLTNLVTPKDQGGAGHDLISVLRIRRSYDRDSQMYSKESDAIRQQLAQEQEKSTVSTVSDVSGANATQLSADPEFAGAEAQAAVVNSAGQNQGDIIFSTAEDDINLSAHSRGEAVDIDQVDNVRCTLIKKKRIGSDNLTMQPATPIKIAWQTSAGYDSSPPPDYSSLQMNLSQIASGQYLDMLDQLGVSADSTENLSSASFGDVVSLVGESLLAEVLNSPSSSISGFSLSDTIKKIGGMILADKLGLPRQPFIEADLTNLSDLETKIGEASFEKSLNINYGSVRGNNLSDVLENIGLRYTEKQLGIQSGTIKPDSMSGASLQLAIGRGMIEQTLKLQAGSFQSDTTFKKLEEIAGQRKIDYLFTNPTEIDDLLHLGIADNNSLKFKNSSDSPDTYATIVGAKVLADHAYIYGYASSAANAMNLAPSQSTGDPRINSTQVNTNLTTSGNAATDRFQSIMTGTLTASAVIDYNNSFHNLYRAIGIDTLSTSLSSSADVRLAFSSWLNTNTNSSQTDCTIKNNITISIAKPGSTTGETEQVVLPEDQVMATFGLRRGDMSRLFGCYNSTPSAVFKGIGESALYNAVKTSSIAEQAQTKFLADHPEISNFLADVDFYQARIKLIQDKVSKIKTDWNGQSNGNAQLQAAIEQINSATNSIQGKIAGINTSGINITNIGANVGVIRQIPTIVDQVLTAVNTAQNGGDQSLRDHANATLTDINEVIHAVDEILSGKEQSSISSLQIGDINTSGNGNNSSSASTTSTNSINRATLVLMLSGKLSPKDFLVSIGANMVENSLNLPTNGVLYFAKYLDAPGRDKNDDKAAFFRAIGQAQFEQTLGMPTFFFQGQYPATLATLSDVRDHVSKSFGISSAEAGARLMQAMGVPGDFSTVEDQTISTISSVVQAANSLDSRLSIKTGTTANFLNGSPVAKSDLGNSDIQMLAGKLNLPEDVITKFIHVRNGDETLEKAKENNFASEISYNDHNPYAAAPTPTTASPDANIHTTDNCPLGFTFNSATKTFSSQFIEDSSYIYTDNTGTHSFPSMADARNYANAATNQSNKIDFVQALSLHSAKDATKVAAINQGITNFIVDPNDAKALSDDDMAWLRDHYQIPVDILNNTFTRQDLVNKQGTSKQIGYYLETLGKTTAERRVTSALLGGITMTFAGLQIDATDIFDALSGNGLQVAYKIGAKYLENQLKINSTLVGKILEAPTAALRNCSLSAIGGNLLGGVLGLGSVSLSGNIYENIGGAKIEQVLGLAASSFRGANIDELITSIGPSKFASVFELPANIVAPTSVTSNLVGAEEAAYISSLPADEQMSGIDNIFQMPDSVPNVSSATLASAGSQIDSLVRNFIHDSSIWTPVTNPSSTGANYQLYRFQQRVGEVDNLVGVGAGSTQKMLSGTVGYSPNEYKRTVSGKTLTQNAGNILNLLGLSDYASSAIATSFNLVGHVKEIFDGITSCGQVTHGPNYTNVSTPTCSYVNIYNDLQTLFGVNFDAKLGLKPGTIANIIQDPRRAAFEFISSALTKLDNSLGLIQGQNASFTDAFQVSFCNKDPRNCLTNTTSDTVDYGSGGYTNLNNRWEYIADRIGTQLVTNWITNLGIVPSAAPTGTYEGMPDTYTLIHESANMLIHGDLRILEVSAGVQALEALHIYDDGKNTDHHVNMPAYYRISFEDVYYAFMGNPVQTQQYANTASQQALYDWQAHAANPLDTISNEAEMAGSTASHQYGSQCPSGVVAADCAVAPGVATTTTTDIWGRTSTTTNYNASFNYNSANDAYDPMINGSTYNYYDNASSAAADFQTHNGVPTGWTPAEDELADPSAMEHAIAQQEAAANQARQDYRNNLMYRMADAKMYQIDPNIPAGFAWTMFKGTGTQKTNILMSYATNALRNVSIGGISLGNIESSLATIKQIRSYLQDPDGFDLDSLGTTGLTNLDSWLNGKFSDFLGFSLPEGTFTSILYGIKNHNFTGTNGNGGYQTSIGGFVVPSVTTIVKDWAVGKLTAWADKALGLPTGTVYTAYTMYRNITAAKSALALAQFQSAFGVIDPAVAAQNLAAAQEKVIQLKAALVSFIISTLFAKQIGQLESALVMVPGTGAMLVSLAVSYLMTSATASAWLAANWVGIAIFILMNLFGVYKVELKCSADGYYPALENPGDPSVVDNGNLGVFDGMNNTSRKDGYIAAAQYKNKILIGDALMLAEKTGDQTAIPSQIMTGRQEDVDYWQYKVDEVICNKIGGCAGSRAGLWANPQTTGYLHIGF